MSLMPTEDINAEADMRCRRRGSLMSLSYLNLAADEEPATLDADREAYSSSCESEAEKAMNLRRRWM